MKKKLLIATAGIALLLVISVVLLLMNINPILASLKPSITQTISDSVGQPVTLGKISARFFPSVAIKINDVALKNAPEQASVETLLLETSIAALLQGEIEVSKLAVSGAKASVIREADGSLALGSLALGGKPNAADTDPTPPPSAAENSDKTDASAEEADAPSLALKLKSAELDDITIEWIDKSVSPEARVSLSDLQASVSDVSTDSDGTIDLSASLLGTKPGNLSIRGTVSLAKTVAGIPKTDITLRLDSIDLEKISALMKSYGADQKDLSISEELSSQVRVTVDDSGIRVVPALDAEAANIAFGEVFHKPKGVRLSFDAKLQPSLLGAMSADSLLLSIAGIEISAPFTFNPSSGTSAKITTPAFPLAELANILPPAKAFKLGGNLDATIQVEAAPPSEKASIPKLNGTIALKSISAMLPGSPGIPLTDLNGSINLTSDSIVLKPLTLNLAGQAVSSNAKISNLSQAEKEIRIEEFTLGAFSGSLNASGKVLKKSLFALRMNGKGFDLAAISDAALKGSSITVKGTVESLKARFAGDSNKLPAALKGNTSFLLTKGEIIGFNLLGQTLGKITEVPGVSGAIAGFVPEKYRPVLEANSTQFDSLSVESGIAKETITLSSLELKHEIYIVTGRGRAGFNGSVDLKAQLRLTPALAEGMILKEPKLELLADKNGNIVIPIVIKKDSQGLPIVLPDVSDLLSRAAKNTAKEAGKRALDKVAPGLGGALDSLF